MDMRYTTGFTVCHIIIHLLKHKQVCLDWIKAKIMTQLLHE